MTNVFRSPGKVDMKKLLFSTAVNALIKDGWTVQRIQGSGKSSVRRITKGNQSKVVSIRTSQDTWIAFPRIDGDTSWRTLDEVDSVVPVSVDDCHNPQFAKIHIIDGDEMRARFNRAYAARKKAGHVLPVGRGVWVSLYLEEAPYPINRVGAGAGLIFPPIATVPLTPSFMPVIEQTSEIAEEENHVFEENDEAPLSIADAKRRLAKTFAVDPASIKITVEA